MNINKVAFGAAYGSRHRREQLFGNTMYYSSTAGCFATRIVRFCILGFTQDLVEPYFGSRVLVGQEAKMAGYYRKTVYSCRGMIFAPSRSSFTVHRF